MASIPIFITESVEPSSEKLVRELTSIALARIKLLKLFFKLLSSLSQNRESYRLLRRRITRLHMS